MIGLLLSLALVGLIVWAIVTYIPMPPVFKTAIMVIAAICIILSLVSAFGIGDIPVPQFHHR